MGIESVKRFGIQRKIVATMTSESWKNIPHVSYTYEPDISAFYEKYLEFRRNFPKDQKLTFNTVLLKAVAEALKSAPHLNAHMHYEENLVRGKITTFDNIDISVPWTLPSGQMMTITMKNMENRSLVNINDYVREIDRRLNNTNVNEALYSVSMRDTMEDLSSGKVFSVLGRLIGSKTNKRHRVSSLKGREKKEYESIPKTDRITSDDLVQGTITVSNIGSISQGLDGGFAMLMIIPPQVCAIGIAAIHKKAVVGTDENGNDCFKSATVLPICICFDHRALDFGDIKPFISRLNYQFEHPEKFFI